MLDFLGPPTPSQQPGSPLGPRYGGPGCRKSSPLGGVSVSRSPGSQRAVCGGQCLGAGASWRQRKGSRWSELLSLEVGGYPGKC